MQVKKKTNSDSFHPEMLFTQCLPLYFVSDYKYEHLETEFHDFEENILFQIPIAIIFAQLLSDRVRVALKLLRITKAVL